METIFGIQRESLSLIESLSACCYLHALKNRDKIYFAYIVL